MRRLVWIGIILGSDLLFAIEGLGFSFDAKKTSMNSKTNAYQFDGNVVAIGSGILIIADLITVTEQPRRIWAKGNLAILAENQLVLGDELIYLPSEKILRIKDANMSFNARDKAQAFINDVLGFTEEEVDFEQKRQGHLVRLQGVMDNVIREYVFWYQNNGSEVDLMQLVHKYQKLKEQRIAIRDQKPKNLARLHPDTRKKFEKRRKQWQASQVATSGLDSLGSFQRFSYFQIKGRRLLIDQTGRFEGEHIFWTPCNCEAQADWGFFAQKIYGQEEGYTSMNHPLLVVGGIPIFYLPYLYLPMKSVRQSGFLYPSFSFRLEDGNTYSQGLFINLGEDKDMTIKTSLMEERGTMMQLNYRQQDRQYSGFDIDVDGILDKKWLAAKLHRSYVKKSFLMSLDRIDEDTEALSKVDWWQKNLSICISGTDREKSLCRQRQVEAQLTDPENKWRGSLRWSYQNIIASRLTLVSEGDVTSDHRFFDDFSQSSEGPVVDQKVFAKAHSISRLGVHLDAVDFYFGAAAGLGDAQNMTKSYSSIQNMGTFTLQSRLMPIENNIIPMYLMAEANLRYLEDLNEPGVLTHRTPQDHFLNLRGGEWKRGMIKQISPISKNSVARIHQFSEFEIRQIRIGRHEIEDHLFEPESLENHIRYQIDNQILATRVGIEIKVPMRADFHLGQAHTQDPLRPHQMNKLAHDLDWTLELSWRPEVSRDGDYGSLNHRLFEEDGQISFDSQSERLVFFPSDLPEASDSDWLDDRLLMHSHQMVTFTSRHSVYTWHEFLERIPVDLSQKTALEDIKIELSEYVKPVPDSRMDPELLEKKGFRLHSAKQAPVFSAGHSVSYDFLKATKKRMMETTKETNKAQLPDPWSPLAVNFKLVVLPIELVGDHRFQVTDRRLQDASLTMNMHLSDSTQMHIQHGVSHSGFYMMDDIYSQTVSHGYEWGIDSSLMSPIHVSMRYGQRHTYPDHGGVTLKDFHRNLIVSYMPRSDCWGLKFQYVEDYEDKNGEGSYYLYLAVKFLGQQRDYGNLAARYNVPLT